MFCSILPFSIMSVSIPPCSISVHPIMPFLFHTFPLHCRLLSYILSCSVPLYYYSLFNSILFNPIIFCSIFSLSNPLCSACIKSKLFCSIPSCSVIFYHFPPSYYFLLYSGIHSALWLYAAGWVVCVSTIDLSFFLFLDRPTEVKLGIYINSFYSISEQTMVNTSMHIQAQRLILRTGWLFGWITGWLTGWLAGWLAGWLTDSLTGCLINWLAWWLIGWLARWLGDCLIGFSVGLL